MTKALGQGYHILLGRWVMEDEERCEARDMDSIPHEGSNLSPPVEDEKYFRPPRNMRLERKISGIFCSRETVGGRVFEK